MAFRLLLDGDLVTVEPGATAPLTVTVTNESDAPDRFELEVEGVDPEWKAIPVPILEVGPGETRIERMFFKPPRASESGAGDYPFIVRVRSLESGDGRTAQGILKVKAYHHLGADVSPKKGYFSPARHQNEFDLSLVNLGNQPLTIELSGSEPDNSCAYEFESNQVEIGPGQQRDVGVTVVPLRSPFLASGRLIGFTIHARVLDVPNVGAHAQAQLEQRAFLSPASGIGILFLAALAGAWWISRPQKPTISLIVDPGTVVKGASVKVAWESPIGSSVRIVDDQGTIVYEGGNSTGNRAYTIDRSGTLTFTATATKDGMKSTESTAAVESTAPVFAPAPIITSFTAEPARVRLGQPVTLRYKFGESVTQAKLGPVGIDLDPALSSYEVLPTKTGDIEYEIVARNTDGKETTKRVKVSVYEESDAQILAFGANPTKVPFAGDPTVLTWKTVQAAVVQLQIGDGDKETVETEGSRQIPVTSKTKLTIYVTDGKGLQKKTSIYVDVQPPVAPPPTTGGPTDGTTDSGLPPSTVTTGTTGITPAGGDPINPPRSGGR